MPRRPLTAPWRGGYTAQKESIVVVFPASSGQLRSSFHSAVGKPLAAGFFVLGAMRPGFDSRIGGFG